MSVYGVNKLCFRAQRDPAFRERLRQDPASAIASFPLSPEERGALLAGDVGTLYRLGAHPFLLGMLPRFELLGLTRAAYAAQMRSLQQPGP